MPISVREWKLSTKTQEIYPVIQDDREKLPPELVKDLWVWMGSRLPEFQAQGPTNQVVSMEGTRFLVQNSVKQVQPTQKGYAAYGKVEFECGSCELFCKAGIVILAQMEYLYAREITSRLEIIGPRLRYQRLAQL